MTVVNDYYGYPVELGKTLFYILKRDLKDAYYGVISVRKTENNGDLVHNAHELAFFFKNEADADEFAVNRGETTLEF